jgi:ADP-heptose:LPS heptosyltransferase
VSEQDGIIKRVASPFAGVANRFRLGLPRRYFRGNGSFSADLASTVVFRELKKRGISGLALATAHPELFAQNADVDQIIPRRNGRAGWGELGLPLVALGETKYDPLRDADEPPDQHALISMCRLANIGGPVELRPYLFLTPKEFAAGKHADSQVVMQSSDRAAFQPMRNKEWYPERFQETCSELRADVQVIQLGSADDPPLVGATDLRGKTTVREAAAILANSLVFIGLAGFLMHLARAVDCRSVIIYGGREKPAQTGYVANKNLYSGVRCAPCWLRNPCEFDRKCMDVITTGQVVAAAAEQISRYGTLLEVQTAQL